MKHLDKKSVQGIVANVAHGKSIETTATLFNVSPLTVGNVVRGVVHADKSGLSGDDVGTKYIRANKDKFPLTVKKVKAVKKTETTTETQPVAPVAEKHADREQAKHRRSLRPGERFLPSLARPDDDLFLQHLRARGRDA